MASPPITRTPLSNYLDKHTTLQTVGKYLFDPGNVSGQFGKGGFLSPADTSGVDAASADARALEQRFMAQMGQREPIPQLQYSGSAPVVYADGAIRPAGPPAQPTQHIPTAQQVADGGPVMARPDLLPSPQQSLPSAQQVAQAAPPVMARPELFGGGAAGGMPPAPDMRPAPAPLPSAGGQPAGGQLDPASLHAMMMAANQPQQPDQPAFLGAPSAAAWPARWGV